MTEENDLERRAVEELLSEAARAKVRAETMGPAGWVKCPLRSTNKRFLLNTLRPTLQRRPGSSATGQSEARDRRQWVEPRSGTQKGVQSRDRSRSPNTSLQRDSNPTTARRPHTDQPVQQTHTREKNSHHHKHTHRQTKCSDRHTHRPTSHSDGYTHVNNDKPTHT